MLYDHPNKDLVHKYWIKGNQKICLNKLDGKCDKLGQKFESYSETIKWATIYEFLYPFVIFVFWIVLTRQVAFSMLFYIFSAIFFPILPIFSILNLYVLIIFLIIGIIIELLYIGYLFRQIGIYTFIPVGAFLFQLVLLSVPYIGSVFGSFFGLIPWSVLAIGTHYIHYEVGMGIVFNAEEKCYIELKKKGEYFLKW